MEMKLAENIRSFRKKRSLTQEQLAEALGVTTGAVHKWEAKLSVPDIGLIISMAELFDASVDVLLGYEMKDSRPEACVKRLQEYRRRKDREGLAEAEIAIMKYPHSFRVVRECALLTGCFGFESGDRALLTRSLELLEQSRMLISQNTDPEISEQTLYGEMATAYLGLNEIDKATELLTAHNAGGLYSHRIGQILALSGRTEEAAPFLSKAMSKAVADLVNVIMGYLNVFFARGDHASAQAILHCGIDLLLGLRKEGRTNYLDKVNCMFLASLALSQLLSGSEDEARESLERAKKLAEFFDASPSYDESDVRFIERIDGASAYDDIGATAKDAVEEIADQNEKLKALWISIQGQEEKDHE